MLKKIMKGRFEENEATTTEASNYRKTVQVDNTVAAHPCPLTHSP